MNQVLLSLGTNKGNKSENINKAVAMIKREIGTVITQSQNYNSEPWGFASKNQFINIVLLVETNLAPTELLKKIKQIEEEIGRKKIIIKSYQDRIIDIDIILYNDLTIETKELSIPHKYAHERNFVIEPIKEILEQIINTNIYKPCQNIIKKYDSL